MSFNASQDSYHSLDHDLDLDLLDGNDIVVDGLAEVASTPTMERGEDNIFEVGGTLWTTPVSSAMDYAQHPIINYIQQLQQHFKARLERVLVAGDNGNTMTCPFDMTLRYFVHRHVTVDRLMGVLDIDHFLSAARDLWQVYRDDRVVFESMLHTEALMRCPERDPRDLFSSAKREPYGSEAQFLSLMLSPEMETRFSGNLICDSRSLEMFKYNVWVSMNSVGLNEMGRYITETQSADTGKNRARTDLVEELSVHTIGNLNTCKEKLGEMWGAVGGPDHTLAQFTVKISPNKTTKQTFMSKLHALCGPPANSQNRVPHSNVFRRELACNGLFFSVFWFNKLGWDKSATTDKRGASTGPGARFTVGDGQYQFRLTSTPEISGYSWEETLFLFNSLASDRVRVAEPHIAKALKLHGMHEHPDHQYITGQTRKEELLVLPVYVDKQWCLILLFSNPCVVVVVLPEEADQGKLSKYTKSVCEKSKSAVFNTIRAKPLNFIFSLKTKLDAQWKNCDIDVSAFSKPKFNPSTDLQWSSDEDVHDTARGLLCAASSKNTNKRKSARNNAAPAPAPTPAPVPAAVLAAPAPVVPASISAVEQAARQAAQHTSAFLELINNGDFFKLLDSSSSREELDALKKELESKNAAIAVIQQEQDRLKVLCTERKRALAEKDKSMKDLQDQVAKMEDLQGQVKTMDKITIELNKKLKTTEERYERESRKLKKNNAELKKSNAELRVFAGEYMQQKEAEERKRKQDFDKLMNGSSPSKKKHKSDNEKEQVESDADTMEDDDSEEEEEEEEEEEDRRATRATPGKGRRKK